MIGIVFFIFVMWVAFQGATSSGLIVHSELWRDIIGVLIEVLLIFTLLFLLSLTGASIKETLQFRGLRAKSFLALSFITMGIVFFEEGAGPLLYKVLPFSSLVEDYAMAWPRDSWRLIVLGLGAMISAPVLEEFIFRGIMQSSLLARYSVKTAIIISSILFGLIHVIPPEVIKMVLHSMIWGYIVYKTGSILASIVMHSLLNSYFLLYNIFWAEGEVLSIDDPSYLFCIAFVVLGIIIISGGLLLLRRMFSISSQ